MSAVDLAMCDTARELLVEQTEAALRAGDELAAEVARAGLTRSRRAAELAAEYLNARRLALCARATLQMEGCW